MASLALLEEIGPLLILQEESLLFQKIETSPARLGARAASLALLEETVLFQETEVLSILRKAVEVLSMPLEQDISAFTKSIRYSSVPTPLPRIIDSLLELV